MRGIFLNSAQSIYDSGFCSKNIYPMALKAFQQKFAVSAGTGTDKSLLDLLPVELSQKILSYLDNAAISANLYVKKYAISFPRTRFCLQ
jgi:hypothetical protein